MKNFEIDIYRSELKKKSFNSSAEAFPKSVLNVSVYWEQAFHNRPNYLSAYFKMTGSIRIQPSFNTHENLFRMLYNSFWEMGFVA